MTMPRAERAQRIAYRRMSGAIGLTVHERGTRGLWWEKRRALFAALQSRGHQIDLVSRMSKYSQQARTHRLEAHHTHLLIEFGSNNRRFYAADLEATEADAKAHAERGGQIIFICDDPDLVYPWVTVPRAHYPRWRTWQNATRPQPFGGQPADIPSDDLPLHTLMPMRDASTQADTAGAPVYLGRPQGRARAIRQVLQAGVPFVVYGRAAEWESYDVEVREAPAQPSRAAFYARQSAALVFADATHKRLGWRTGRAYHALAAGCPPIAEDNHPGLAPYMPSWHDAEDLRAWLARMRDPADRAATVHSAQKLAQTQVAQAERTFAAAGL